MLALWPLALLFPAAVPFGLEPGAAERLGPRSSTCLASTRRSWWLPTAERPRLDPRRHPSGERAVRHPGLQGSASPACCWGGDPPEQASTLLLAVVGVGITVLYRTLLVKSSVKRGVAAGSFITIGVGVTALALGYGLTTPGLAAAPAAVLLVVTWHLGAEPGAVAP